MGKQHIRPLKRLTSASTGTCYYIAESIFQGSRYFILIIIFTGMHRMPVMHALGKKNMGNYFLNNKGKHRPIYTEEYQKHVVFSELNKYIDFYEGLSHTVFGFLATGTNAILNFESYIFSSIKGTLESIFLILKDGKINDSYALLRKYYDSAMINIYSNLYLDDHVSIENFIVEKIDNWLKGTDQLPEFRVMSNYIRESSKILEINNLLYSDGRYKKIRDRCNDNTHYNFFYNMLYNDSEIYLEHRIKFLTRFSIDIKDIFILHVAYLFHIRDHYMTSSDYVDALECGIEPKLDSQYWVAPYVQQIFDEIITKNRPDIVESIKKNSCMQLK